MMVASPKLLLADLPHDHLTTIAEYLPKTSRLLFAVALMTTSTSSFSATTPSDASKAIISTTTKTSTLLPAELQKDEHAKEYYFASGFEILDFVDISDDCQCDLAMKLTDDDMGALLVCIDAKNTLKTLRLGHCIGIFGRGLQPLRGSTVLTHISFNVKDGLEPSFCPKAIVPILDSIIGPDINSLLHLKIDLPNEWKKEEARDQTPLNDFLVNINKLMMSEGKCVGCHESDECEECACDIACLTCFKGLCGECNDYTNYRIRQCGNCERISCDLCEDDLVVCQGCSSCFCSACAQKENVDAALCCEGCTGYQMCLSCAVADETCEHCLGLHFPALVTKSEKQAEEVKELQKEVEELRKQLASGLGILK